jgi:hypothetical protein
MQAVLGGSNRGPGSPARDPLAPLHQVTQLIFVSVCCHLLIVDCLINMATPQLFIISFHSHSTSQHFLPMQSSMPAACITLTCLIEGDSSPFIVKPTVDMSIMELRKLIQDERKNGVLRNVDAADLMLWKVRMIMGQRYHN